MNKISCPACQKEKMSFVAKIIAKDFDGSVFNFTGELLECENCQFGRISSSLSDTLIAQHYSQDCLYSLMSGVGVGGETLEDITRYDYYINILNAQKLLNGQIVDVGCSRGGFLKYLKRNYPNIQVTGVDIDEKSLSSLSEYGISSVNGNAFNLSFQDCSIDLLCYFHVLEHILDVDSILVEANRVLKEDGKILIEVPDAEHYVHSETRVGAFFWLAMKEHVNHFSLASLTSYCTRNGFGISEVYRSHLPMKNSKRYPSLVVVLYKENHGEQIIIDNSVEFQFQRRTSIREHYNQEKYSLMMELESCLKFLKNYEEVTFWGIGLEFFVLFPQLFHQLKNFKINLVDSNPGKHGYLVDGLIVMPPSQLSAHPLNALIPCSYMSSDAIIEAALALGWKMDNIYILS